MRSRFHLSPCPPLARSRPFGADGRWQSDGHPSNRIAPAPAPPGASPNVIMAAPTPILAPRRRIFRPRNQNMPAPGDIVSPPDRIIASRNGIMTPPTRIIAARDRILSARDCIIACGKGSYDKQSKFGVVTVLEGTASTHCFDFPLQVLTGYQVHHLYAVR